MGHKFFKSLIVSESSPSENFLISNLLRIASTTKINTKEISDLLSFFLRRSAKSGYLSADTSLVIKEKKEIMTTKFFNQR
jgi:hypothetical protein